jgi:sulfatase modifying factor 1
MRPTRELVPNGYGLVAMAGTLNEWCLDWYDAREYLQNPARNPAGTAERQAARRPRRLVGPTAPPPSA